MSGFADWCPATYLRDYCTSVPDDERATLKFLVEELANEAPVSQAIDFGAGPTLHHALPLVTRARHIDVADLLQSNLDEIQRWQRGAADAHDWSAFTRTVLELEGGRHDAAARHEREMRLRLQLRQRLRGDARQRDPLGAGTRGRYGIVVSCYCADSATDELAACQQLLSNIASLVAPGGLLLLACLRRCPAYRVGSRRFPSAGVDERHLAHWLAAPSLDLRLERLQVAASPRQRELGYDAVLLASARRLSPTRQQHHEADAACTISSS